MNMLTRDLAQRFAAIALGHLTREYPHKLDHVLEGDEDLLPPRVLHPIFHGSFDWHSCVHGYWLLLRIRRSFPDIPLCRDIEALADRMLVPAKAEGELAYLGRASSAGFERPYGWAWLLALHREASRHGDRGWADTLGPLAFAFADRFRSFLPKLTYPIRTGTHFNTAFALVLAIAWADDFDAGLAALMRSRAIDYFGGDRDCPAWEPGGDEFLSAALVEALCMKQALAADAFRDWFAGFLPRLNERRPEALFVPAHVSDRSDGKIAHLDGFNLSRAWCWRELGAVLSPEFEQIAGEAAAAHLDASLPFIAGDYMGEHWLATFALLALEGLG